MIFENDCNKAFIDEELPYIDELDNEIGIKYTDRYVEVNKSKFIIDEWIETTETVHDCINDSEDCKRCANNDKVTYHYIVINSIKGKTMHTFEQHCEDQLGSLWSDWSYCKEFIPAR